MDLFALEKAVVLQERLKVLETLQPSYASDRRLHNIRTAVTGLEHSQSTLETAADNGAHCITEYHPLCMCWLELASMQHHVAVWTDESLRHEKTAVVAFGKAQDDHDVVRTSGGSDALHVT